MIDSQEIGLHVWLLDNVLPDLAHIVQSVPEDIPEENHNIKNDN